ncbi:odorant receptor 49b-like [Tribolium madens]|uniref:odorant receptor 49b-like n=1 Tax=Tribolium madens TaxID=41895 RepID=UPI001CF72D2A|nr:odorant receptor 49b-like [Tribolium madens]
MIKICKFTRKNMQISLIWPRDFEELNPGKWYYIKIAVFLLTYGLFPFCTFLHLIVTVKNHLDIPVSENIGVVVSNIGISYMAIIYVQQQNKIAQLLKDLSDFKDFGTPPCFEKQNKRLNFWSICAFIYPTCGASLYNISKLFEKSECNKIYQQNGLPLTCGFIFPIWVPFNINYFPVFHIILICTWFCTTMFVRLHLSISYNAFEIAHHIILRIKHLNEMILECFDDENYKISRKKFTRCVLYYKQILDLSSRLNDSFSSIMFVHFTMTSAVCGCLEKQFVDGEYVGGFIHLVGWIISLFIASVGGQDLVNASESISEAIWSSKWYLADVRLKKDVLFMLMRSQKDLHMSVGSFGVLSYAFFVSVLKMSYSILAMLTS